MKFNLELAKALIVSIMIICLLIVVVLWVMADMPYNQCKDKPDNYTLFPNTQNNITCGQIRNITTMEG